MELLRKEVRLMETRIPQLLKHNMEILTCPFSVEQFLDLKDFEEIIGIRRDLYKHLVDSKIIDEMILKEYIHKCILDLYQ